MATPRLAFIPRRKLTLLPLVAATYFMVSGGPYGLEDLIQSAGYGRALLVLAITPLLWALPTALMVGELASAIPEEGGYYEWVRRAMGPFWGFQEAWLSLAASVFDMALYPTLFVLYLGRIWPRMGDGHVALAVGVAVIAACVLWNLGGARSVGKGSVVVGALLLAPFVVMAVGAMLKQRVMAPPVTGPHLPLVMGVLVVMWNYMGWDNASTIAGEVENPQRNYPVGVMLGVGAVAATYLFVVSAAWRTGIAPAAWETGAWVEVATAVGGRGLGLAVVAGGMLCGLGMMNALVLSYSRVPMAMAQDGLLPRALSRTSTRTGAPWVSILVCAVAWSLSLGLGFERLIELDVMLAGLSIVLEFAALIVLRVREPGLPRPFRVPGGLAGAVLIAVPPALLLGAAMARSVSEQGLTRGLLLGLSLVAAGPASYFIVRTTTP
ncbi:MAG TPA: APC family permease [Terriglobales bacterium]|nr:APC family permease [Terriglobales bacterium]